MGAKREKEAEVGACCDVKQAREQAPAASTASLDKSVGGRGEFRESESRRVVIHLSPAGSPV